MTETTPRTRVHATGTWNFDDALSHVRSYWQTDDDARAEAAQRMVDTDCGTWHAVHETIVARYNDGRTPTDICTLCGGRNVAGQGNHCMCDARARRNPDGPFARLDIVDSLQCSCFPCSHARGER